MSVGKLQKSVIVKDGVLLGLYTSDVHSLLVLISLNAFAW
jgi:hypothetical protein